MPAALRKSEAPPLLGGPRMRGGGRAGPGRGRWQGAASPGKQAAAEGGRVVGSERFVGRLCHRRAALSLMRRRDAAAGGALGLAGRWACASAPVVPSASGSFHTEVVIFSCKYERAAHSGSRGGKRSRRPVVAPENPARRAREVGQHAVGRHLLLTARRERGRNRG